MKSKKHGSSYLLVVGALLIAALGSSMLFRTLVSRSYKIKALHRRMDLYGAADAGIVEAIHKLKRLPFPKTDGPPIILKGKLMSASYEATIAFHPSSKTATIVSVGRDGIVVRTRTTSFSF